MSLIASKVTLHHCCDVTVDHLLLRTQSIYLLVEDQVDECNIILNQAYMQWKREGSIFFVQKSKNVILIIHVKEI